MKTIDSRCHLEEEKADSRKFRGDAHYRNSSDLPRELPLPIDDPSVLSVSFSHYPYSHLSIMPSEPSSNYHDAIDALCATSAYRSSELRIMIALGNIRTGNFWNISRQTRLARLSTMSDTLIFHSSILPSACNFPSSQLRHLAPMVLKILFPRYFYLAFLYIFARITRWNEVSKRRGNNVQINDNHFWAFLTNDAFCSH